MPVSLIEVQVSVERGEPVAQAHGEFDRRRAEHVDAGGADVEYCVSNRVRSPDGHRGDVMRQEIPIAAFPSYAQAVSGRFGELAQGIGSEIADVHSEKIDLNRYIS